MRYFLDTEYNGFEGELISLALTPEYGDQEFYAALPLPSAIHPWVERNVLPYLHMGDCTCEGEMSAREAGLAIADYLSVDQSPAIVADWPDDIAHFCSLLTTGPGEIVNVGRIEFQLLRTPGFSAAKNSVIPHNALHDARALRSFVLDQEALIGTGDPAPFAVSA